MIPNFLSADELARLWLRDKCVDGIMRLLFLDLDGVLFHESKGVRTLLPDSLRRLVRTCYEGHLSVVLISDAWPERRTVQQLGEVLGAELCCLLHETQPRVPTNMPSRPGRIAQWLAFAHQELQPPARLRVCGIVDDSVYHYCGEFVPEWMRDALVPCSYDEGFAPKQEAIMRRALELPMTPEWDKYSAAGLSVPDDDAAL